MTGGRPLRLEMDAETQAAMAAIAEDLGEVAERVAIGLQNSAGAAQQIADAYARMLDAWLRDVVVIVERPYTCPVDRCRWRDDVGSTCPIHLRDLQPTTLDVTTQGVARRKLETVMTTVAVA